MTGDFHENEIDEYGWNNGVSDYPTLFDGTDMVCYEESIRPAVEQYTGNLMSYFYKQRNPGIKEKVISAIPSIEIRNGELMGCTTVVLKEPLADEEMEDLQDYLHGQFSDGWGEGFEQQEIQTDDGVLYVHFGEAEPFYFEVEQMQPAEPMKEQLPPHRPKMKLVGQDGNIFSILGRASRLLKENGQPDQAKEMEHSGGDGWTILHGDTLQVIRAFKPQVFDAIITDPPYASGGWKPAEKNRTTNQKYSSMDKENALPDFDGDQKDQRSWTRWMAEWLSDARKACKPGAPICLFIDWRQYPSITDALQWAGWIWRGCAVWDKMTSRPQKGRFRQQSEYIVWGSNGPMPGE